MASITAIWSAERDRVSVGVGSTGISVGKGVDVGEGMGVFVEVGSGVSDAGGGVLDAVGAAMALGSTVGVALGCAAATVGA